MCPRGECSGEAYWQLWPLTLHTKELSVTRLAIPLLFFLYLFRLGGVGMLGPDEPRYAAVGSEMAHSGDWITPHLWGQPWFEKPALIYWMIGAAERLGLRDEWGARLPVALTAIAFLIFFYWILRREFGAPAALFSTALCATSAGWLAYSFAAVTDLPMTATLVASLLLAVSGAKKLTAGAAWAIGILLGLAVLAKGLGPLVLFAPALWLLRRQWRAILIVAAALLVTAGPWYTLCTLRNGRAFVYEFFWRHHFERFVSGSLMHVQPLWYYVPVLLAGLFPWTLLLPMVFRKSHWSDVRLRFLWIWVLFGLAFFSPGLNKLPGYVLPLLPAICILIGVALTEAPRARTWLAATTCLLVLVPVVADRLPRALLVGITRAGIWQANWIAGLPFLALAAVVWWLETRGRRTAAVMMVAFTIAVSLTFLKWKDFPALDRQVSVRIFWGEIAPRAEDVCLDESVRRNWVFGLNYYAQRELPSCEDTPKPLVIRDQGANGLVAGSVP